MKRRADRAPADRTHARQDFIHHLAWDEIIKGSFFEKVFLPQEEVRQQALVAYVEGEASLSEIAKLLHCSKARALKLLAADIQRLEPLLDKATPGPGTSETKCDEFTTSRAYSSSSRQAHEEHQTRTHQRNRAPDQSNLLIVLEEMRHLALDKAEWDYIVSTYIAPRYAPWQENWKRAFFDYVTGRKNIPQIARSLGCTKQNVYKRFRQTIRDLAIALDKDARFKGKYDLAGSPAKVLKRLRIVIPTHELEDE